LPDATTSPFAKIAAVVGADSTKVQALFAKLAADWHGRGTRAVGVVAEPHGHSGRSCNAGFLRDITSGNRYSIYLETAPNGTSCHIDAEGVETACAAILEQISTGDVIILSKYGKLETMGRGLSAAFEAAMAAGKPILTSVSEKHLAAWQALAPGALSLEADEATLAAWCRSVLARAA